jgi:diguanylate cyclase (GGDEF)-like protein/PAS domain S-box-containing protein
LTGLDDDALALSVLHAGAQDYLVKGQIEARSLLRALRYAIERKCLEDAARLEKERAQATLNCLGDAVICTDTAGDITVLNIVAERVTGWTWQAAVGRQVTEVMQLTGRDSLLPGAPVPPPHHTKGSRLPSSCTLVRHDSGEIPIEYLRSTIDDARGVSIGTVVVFRDVTEAHATSLAMLRAAEHDGLTGLPNRALLGDRICQAISAARRHSKHVALLFLDLDGFKHINDSLGHPVGDKLLQSVAARIKNCGRAADTISRLGGDEFVVMLSELDQAEDAGLAARRILGAIAEAHIIDDHELHITASIGVSVFPDDGDDAETLVKNADTAMYQAKENGRQRYQFFKPAMNARAVERQSIEQSLRRAVDRHEFALHYQPKIDFKTGLITGAEALIRWTHPTRGSIPPVQFIPVAEACGLIVPIGHWVLREACEQSRAWLDAGIPVATMAVNVSALEFRQEDFLEGVTTILQETGLDPHLLELELTELRVVAEGVETLEQLIFLRDHACDEAQGYFFSPPVTPQLFAKLLRAGIPTVQVVS